MSKNYSMSEPSMERREFLRKAGVATSASALLSGCTTLNEKMENDTEEADPVKPLKRTECMLPEMEV